MTVVLHVPHASTYVPEDVRGGILLDDTALAHELLGSTDHHTDLLVAGLEAAAADDRVTTGRVRVHVNAHSRLVVDPERFLDPALEATERVGRGAVYTRGFDGRLLRDVDAPGAADLRADLIARYFVPYHAAVERIVEEGLAASETCTIVDVHSYPRLAQPYELDGGTVPDAVRPELCIGTDRLHTPPALTALVEEAAASLGIATARDTPFAGTFVPTRWMGDTRVRSVMLEIRRDTYMDEATGALDDAGAGRMRELVARVVAAILADPALAGR